MVWYLYFVTIYVHSRYLFGNKCKHPALHEEGSRDICIHEHNNDWLLLVLYILLHPQIKHTQNKLECSLDSHFTLDKAKHHRSAYAHWSHVIIVYCLWAAIMKHTDSSQDKTHRKCSLLSLLKQHTRLLIHISHKLQVKQACWQQHTLLINTIQ